MVGKGHHPEKASESSAESTLIQVNPKNTPLHLSGEATVQLKAVLSTDPAICAVCFAETRPWPKPVLSLLTDS
jgi:hypothetical protein